MDQSIAIDDQEPDSNPGSSPDSSRFMRRALELATGGRGAVSPNPLVGAVVTGPGDEVLGEGFHARLGERHAEVAAIEDARGRGADLAGGTMYVTLEPCAHQGRQPPCVEAILAAGIGRVVIGSGDPTPKASGRGPEILRDGGVEVVWSEGEDATAARRLNQAFRKHARTGRPLVVLKSALTLDGRTATAAGDSRWISGPASRELVHRWRAELDAVAVGVATAVEDDALLTARDVNAARQPTRVIFDSSARLPLESRIVASVGEAPVVVIAGAAAPRPRIDALDAAGVEVITCSGEGAAQVGAALDELGDRGIASVLLEGGATLAGSFRDAGELDELRLFYAPILLGGAAARPLLGGSGSGTIGDADRALSVEWRSSGEDALAIVRMREW
jgi:diaminohydroxyphosphoribosylaminopyrimidine deaminase/5-amino-6-(5-phosphoribosylamino)uracil reductase